MTATNNPKALFNALGLIGLTPYQAFVTPETRNLHTAFSEWCVVPIIAFTSLGNGLLSTTARLVAELLPARFSKIDPISIFDCFLSVST